MPDRKAIKQNAQDRLMGGMQIALSRLAAQAAEDDGFSDEKPRAVYDEAIIQFRRIEKLFGYQPGTWTAGV